MSGKKYVVYILLCSDNTLYTGWTDDLAKRIMLHSLGKASKYTRSRLPVVEYYTEEFDTKNEAMSRECAIKKMSRGKKLKLKFDYGGGA
jgi:putative endonuclease